MPPFAILIAAVIVIPVLIFFILSYRAVPDEQIYIIERLGSFRCEWQSGIHFLVPFADRIAGKVSLSEKINDPVFGPFRTEDGAVVQVPAVIFYQVTDAKQYIYSVSAPEKAFEELASVTVCRLISTMDLNTAARSKRDISRDLTGILDNAANIWGIKVNSVDVKNIITLERPGIR